MLNSWGAKNVYLRNEAGHPYEYELDTWVPLECCKWIDKNS